LQKSSTSISALQRNEQTGESELTTYLGDPIDERTAIYEVGKIRNAFPALTPQFADILIERAIAKGFTAQRLTDAVNHVIDNCQYPSPTLANFLSFDKRVKIISYNELCDLVTTHRASFNDYQIIKINAQNYWIKKSDKDIYNIPDEL